MTIHDNGGSASIWLRRRRGRDEPGDVAKPRVARGFLPTGWRSRAGCVSEAARAVERGAAE